MLTQLKSGAKVVGAKQVKRAITQGRATMVFMAENADPLLLDPLTRLCTEQDVPVHWVATMVELGKACDITVGAAVAALMDSKG